jgi:glutamate dehydrogenase
MTPIPNPPPSAVDVLDAVAAAVASQAAPAERALAEAFAREVYRQVDAEDLAAARVDDLAGAALSHWQFGRLRAPAEAGRARVRVLSPTLAEHGWTSRHTVVEIVNDDMPFLVDSASMEVHRQGLSLHLIVHPVLAVARDAAGQVTRVTTRRDAPDLPRESWMHIQVDRLMDAAARQQLAAGIERVLADVRAATADWPAMREKLLAAAAELGACRAGAGARREPRLPRLAGERQPGPAGLSRAPAAGTRRRRRS